MKTLSVLLFALALPAHADPAAVEGTWLSGDGDGLIELHVNTIKLRGYIGISLAGRTETWARQTPEP